MTEKELEEMEDDIKNLDLAMSELNEASKNIYIFTGEVLEIIRNPIKLVMCADQVADKIDQVVLQLQILSNFAGAYSDMVDANKKNDEGEDDENNK